MPKIDTLEPEFREKVQQLIASVEEITGRRWVVTSGRRTMKEQQGLL